MFLANAAYEYPFLSALGAPSGDRHYRAMQVLGRLTWFIVSCAVVDDGLEMLQSVCCSLEDDLISLLQPMQKARVVSVMRVAASENVDGRWEPREVARIWRTETRSGRTVLIFEDLYGSQMSGRFDDQNPDETRERTLLFEAPLTSLPQPVSTFTTTLKKVRRTRRQ